MWWSKKIIYFIRHGQSANNASNVRQGASGSLSELGQTQARFVGERFKHIPVDIIFTSPYQRAKETSTFINETLKKKIVESPLLIERKNPSEIVGKDADSPEVQKIMDVIDRSFHQSDLRYSDEENFEDLRKRAENLLAFLAARPEKHIMCVSHRIFLKMVISYIEKGNKLESHEFVKLDFLNPINNAAVTVVQYSPLQKWRSKNPWKVLVFNDYGRIVK